MYATPAGTASTVAVIERVVPAGSAGATVAALEPAGTTRVACTTVGARCAPVSFEGSMFVDVGELCHLVQSFTLRGPAPRQKLCWLRCAAGSMYT